MRRISFDENDPRLRRYRSLARSERKIRDPTREFLFCRKREKKKDF